MAIPVGIDVLLGGQTIENERLEFKETWDPQASLKTICAFANDLNNWGGGYVVIGVHEEPTGIRSIKGVPSDQADRWLKDIFNKCKLIQPDYMPVAEVMQADEKNVLVLWCPGGSTRPYSSPKSMGKKSERVHWIRHMSSTAAPTPEEERELFSLANNVPFDDRPNHGADLADFSLPLIKSYLKEVGSSLYERADTDDFADLCRSMKIAAGPDEYVRPINVGLLFFSPDPNKFFPYTQIDVVEFPDGEGGDRLIEHSFTGPLNVQLTDALRYLNNNVVAEEVVKSADGGASQRTLNYPPEAIKEALANAVYHKGYDSREPIEVRVLPDRIEILSHPGADRSISQRGLKDYRMASRRYRNRRIGEFLKELGLTEGRNTGVHKILRALRENGSPDPLFETDEERLYFMVTLYARAFNDRSDAAGTNTGGTEPESPAITTESREERVTNLLAYFRANPQASITSASHVLGIPLPTLNRYVADLKKSGILARDGRRGPWTVSD